MRKLWISLSLAATAAQAAPLKSTGSSSVKVQALKAPGNLKNATRIEIKNTTFHVADRMLIPEAGDFIDYVGEAVNRPVTIQAVEQRSLSTGTENVGGPLELTAFDSLTGRKLWTLKDSLRSEFKAEPNAFAVRTTLYGCCGSQDSHRLYGLYSGSELLRYSFTDRSKLPVVLTQSWSSLNGRRFLGYLDAYWPAGEKDAVEVKAPEGLKVAGTITYASPHGRLQRAVLFYDEKAAGDPSADPSEIRITQGKNEWRFDGKTDRMSVESWMPRGQNQTEPAKVFTDFKVRLTMPCKDKVEFAVQNDRLDFSKTNLKRNQCYKHVTLLN